MKLGSSGGKIPIFLMFYKIDKKEKFPNRLAIWELQYYFIYVSPEPGIQ